LKNFQPGCDSDGNFFIAGVFDPVAKYSRRWGRCFCREIFLDFHPGRSVMKIF